LSYVLNTVSKFGAIDTHARVRHARDRCADDLRGSPLVLDAGFGRYFWRFSVAWIGDGNTPV
jgi:hypothetical protein